LNLYKGAFTYQHYLQGIANSCIVLEMLCINTLNSMMVFFSQMLEDIIPELFFRMTQLKKLLDDPRERHELVNEHKTTLIIADILRGINIFMRFEMS
jgi:hypothetical protein